MNGIFLAYVAMCFFCSSESFSQDKSDLQVHPQFRTAVQYYDKNNPDSAYLFLCRELVDNPRFAPAYYYIGLIFHDMNILDSAETYYKKAIEIDPNYPNPYSDLSVVKLNQNKLVEAKRLAEKCVALDSMFVNGYLNLGSILFRLEEKEAGTSAFFQAAVVGPDQVYNAGTSSLTQNKDPNTAKFYFTLLLSAHPDYYLALLNLSAAERMLGELDSAESHLALATHIADLNHESFKVIYASYFRLLLDRERYDQIFTKCFSRVGEEYPDAYFFRCLAFFKKHDHDKFVTDANRYFQLSKQQKPMSLDSWASEKVVLQQ